MVQFEKPPKSASAKMAEGLIMLVIAGLICAAIASIAISTMGRERRKPPPPVEPAK